MRISHVIEAVDANVAGMPARNLIAGLPLIRGKNMVEKLKYVQENLDWIRTSTLLEPRGHGSMSGTIFTEPCNPEADMGIIYIDASGYLPMCGSSTIGSTTVLLETGMVAVTEPITEVIWDTPAGLVRARAHVENNIVKSVTFKNIPSFLFASDEVDIPGHGKVKVDVAYGGNTFAIVEAASVGVTVAPNNVNHLLLQKVQKIQDAVNDKIKFAHPEKPFIKGVDHVQLYASSLKPEVDSKNIMVMLPSSIDRSPCGTGTSARVASLFNKGELKLGEEFVYESVIGSIFKAKVVEETMVGPYPAVIPEVTGTAYITSMIKLLIDPDDPFKDGFFLG